MTAPTNQEFVSGTTITSQWLNGVNDAINNSTQDIPGSEARTLLDKLSDVVSIKDFGAVGDGVTDDTAAIQAAINSGNKHVSGISGETYRITNTLTINTDAFELSFNNSTLYLDDATGVKSHIKVGNGSTQKGAIRINGITFTRGQTATNGYAIETDLVSTLYINDCHIYGDNKIYGGIKLYRCMISTVANNYIRDCVSVGLYLLGTDNTSNRTIDISVRENRFEGSVHAIKTSDFVEGLFCRDNIFFNTSSVGVTLSATSNANGLGSFKLQDNDFDTCGASGLYIDNIGNIQVGGCWFSNNQADDIQIKSNAYACIITANQIYPNFIGVLVEGDDCRINSNLISGGTICVALYSSANRAGVCGNTLENAQYGIHIGTAPNAHVVGNLLQNNSLNGITGDGGVGAVVQNNKGDQVVGGSSFITVGASPYTYTAWVRPEHISIFAGTVSEVKLGGSAIQFTTNCGVTLAPGQTVTVTYSSIPYMVKNQL